MNNTIRDILKEAESNDEIRFENALLDLRLVIERFTQNRYDRAGEANYLLLFHDQSLINFRLDGDDLAFIKHFLFYGLFNYPDRSILIAKCIKVLFDPSVREAICIGIETYMDRNDGTTIELMLAITDCGEPTDYFGDPRILNLFKWTAEFGPEYPKENALRVLDDYSKYYPEKKY